MHDHGRGMWGGGCFQESSEIVTESSQEDKSSKWCFVCGMFRLCPVFVVCVCVSQCFKKTGDTIQKNYAHSTTRDRIAFAV